MTPGLFRAWFPTLVALLVIAYGVLLRRQPSVRRIPQPLLVALLALLIVLLLAYPLALGAAHVTATLRANELRFAATMVATAATMLALFFMFAMTVFAFLGTITFQRWMHLFSGVLIPVGVIAASVWGARGGDPRPLWSWKIPASIGAAMILLALTWVVQEMASYNWTNDGARARILYVGVVGALAAATASVAHLAPFTQHH